MAASVMASGAVAGIAAMGPRNDASGAQGAPHDGGGEPPQQG